jgi:thymidylate kinase
MIAFSGLDGAGKSTQINLLKTYFDESGNKIQIFWSRGGYTPGIENLKGLLRKANSTSIPANRGASKKREQSFSKTIVRKVWLSLAILDLIYFYGFYIRVKEMFGVKVICDRYIFDTSIDFKLNFPQENCNNWMLWKVLLLVAAKPKKHFVLTVPISISQQRSILKNEPFPDSKETLQARLAEYLTYVSLNKNAVHVDGSLPIDKVWDFILKELNK